MNIRGSFYITDLKFKIEKKIEVYTPNLISHLSKQSFDEYLIKSEIFKEFLKILEIDNINQVKIEAFLNKKFNE